MRQNLDTTNIENVNDITNVLTTEINKITRRKKIDPEIEFFLDEDGKIKYHPKCMKCQHQCKQSWRCKNVYCPKFSKIKDETDITE